MRLGIVSDCIHFKHPDGRIGTETHILLKQLESLFIYFDEIVLCCPFVAYDETKVASYYQSEKLSVIELPNAGGDSFSSKLKIITTIPKWLSAFSKLNKEVDIIYQRFPNNLNIPGFFYFYFKQRKVFATYTGTWNNYLNEPITYRFQKWLLKKYFRGPVWAYLEKESTQSKIKKGFSPSYSKTIWDEETTQVNARIKKLQQEPITTLKLISVGIFNQNKNQQLILDACLQLYKSDINFRLTLVGDGPLKEQYQKFISENQLENKIFIAGKKTSEELRILYRENDFVLQSPIQEGFGKVPVEGFFHGLIPILSDVALAKLMVDNGNRGFVFKSRSVDDLVIVLKQIINEENELPQKIVLGRDYAATQTLEAWAKGYYDEIDRFYNHK